MNLTNLKLLFAKNNCEKIYVKNLSANDLSKSQVYLSGSFDVLNIFPISKIVSSEIGKWESERFKAFIKFSWLADDGKSYPAPNAKFILYPAYPEVRFSGFLLGCENAPSKTMNYKIANRLLFLSVNNSGTILGYAADPDSELVQEFQKEEFASEHGVFKIIELPQIVNNKEKLLAQLHRIYTSDWIRSKRLGKHGEILVCEAPNCGGYTLEAELGIIPNGYSEPDYLGWEVKQFGVSNFKNINSAIITLMTPEPTNGIYKTEGAESFLRKYGYPDRTGREDRINFGGVHKIGVKHSLTGLKMELIGFDSESGKIRNASGSISLLNDQGEDTASWSFASLLLHWNRKHNQACYVPSLSKSISGREYKYGNNIILGTGTDFQLFLSQMALGNIYYDPGIKMENASIKPVLKKRSQFRIKSQYLPHLYKVNEIIDIA